MIEESKKQQILTFFVLAVLLVMAVFAFTKIKSITGFAVMSDADVIAGKDVYEVGEMAHLFIFPSDADYEIEVYDAEGKFYANSLNFPVEKAGTYTVTAVLSHENKTKTVSTQFEVIEEEEIEEVEEIEETTSTTIIGEENVTAEEITGETVEDIINETENITSINFTIEKIDDNITVNVTENITEESNVSLLNVTLVANESTPINISVAPDVTEPNTSTATGVAPFLAEAEIAEEIGDTVNDEDGKAVGKKVEDEEDYETFFIFVGKEGSNFRLSFYHNNTAQLPVWIEGDVNAEISNNMPGPNETVNVTVPLADGKIPKFKLHVGQDSDVFEFGITIINVKSYPSIGGNWTVRFTTEGIADLIITAINGTEFGNDLEFLQLKCGNNVLNADYSNGRVYYPSYSCDEEGAEVSKIISGGEHHLMFEFGDDKGFANNYAANYVCDDGCTYSDLTSCLDAINGTDAGCLLNESNKVYIINADMSFYMPLTEMTDAVIRINETGITLDCNGTDITGKDKGYGIYVEPYLSTTIKNCRLYNFSYGIIINSNHTNITNNTIYYSINFDLNLTSNANHSNIWLNSFYSKGISYEGENIDFCIGTTGNFYNSTLGWDNIGTGDCGPVNLTFPRGGQRFFKQDSTTIKINWSNQSSPNTITYYLHYSTDNGSTWAEIDSTTGLEYNWDISNIVGDDDFMIKIIPNDGTYNGTNNQSAYEFDIADNNNFVCADMGKCEYQNITGALFSINNSAIDNITLVDPNTVYTINSDYKFYIPLGQMTEAVIRINATNITLDCGNSLLEGSNAGMGIYFEYLSNITIKRCILENFSCAINISNGKESLILNNTLINNRNASMWLHVNRTRIINNTIDNSGGGFTGIDIGIGIVYSSFNNTIKGNMVNDSNPWGIFVGSIGKGTSGNNTVVNNTVERSPYGITVGVKTYNNTIVNNTVDNSTIYGIYLYEASTLDADNNYITGNSVYNSGSDDLFINSAANANNVVVLNNFYSTGVNDSGTTTDFCVAGEGNFYVDGLNRTYIDYVLSDCGPANITFPNVTAVFKADTELKINWTNQSSYYNLTYYVFYSYDSGSTWAYSGATNETNYSLDLTSLPNSPDFAIKVTPFDGIKNATYTNVSGFRIGNDNQWVCSSKTTCEYQNVSGALLNENNTANNITLIEGNYLYLMESTKMYNISVDSGDEGAIMINGTNITLNCIGSEIKGNFTGYGLYANSFDNLTIQNCKFVYYNIGANTSNGIYSVFSNVKTKQNKLYGFYVFNVTNSSFANINSSDNTWDNMYLMNSSNNTITNSRFVNSTNRGGVVLNKSSYNTLDSINSSSNDEILLSLANNSDNNIIKNSNFENTTNTAVAIYSNNNTFFNNTVKKARTSGLAGIVVGKVAIGSGIYNNVSNNTIENTEIPLIATSYGNWIQNNIINGSYTTTYGAIAIMGDLVQNNTVKNNEINNSQGAGIFSGFYVDGYATKNNITGNIVERSNLSGSGYYDLYLNASSNNTNVWNNSFYTGGVLDNGTNNVFCIGNDGNFYEESVDFSSKGSDDCGSSNITAPDGNRSYKGTIQINWTKQSSRRNISYHIYYTNNTGTNWTYLASTSYTNYSWDTSWLENYTVTTFLVKVIPYDNYYNATYDNSTTTFNITVDNNWVCSNSSFCEYQDISSALKGQNNTNEVITLMDANTIYTVNNSLTYNISPTGSNVALNISKSNVTLDCNNSLLMGSAAGYGIYVLDMENITILNCRVYNYSFGMTIISGIFDRLANITINSSKKTGLNLSHVNKSTVEYGNVFASVTGNLILENSRNNTIKQSNFTNSSEYGVYLVSSSYNRFYTINSSANNLENMYFDIHSDNNTVENSTFANSTRSNIYSGGDRNNITTSYFANITTAYADLVINGSASYTSVWLNNFYSRGVNNSGLNSIFCVNNSGNYYNVLLPLINRVTGSCGNLSEPYADKDGDGYYTIYDCDDTSIFFYPGAIEFCDDKDNDCDGNIDEGGVCPLKTFKSAGTGTQGGGGGFSTITYRTVNIIEEPVFTMAKYEETKFTVKGVQHILKINKLYEEEVNITISSDEINFLIRVNETRKLDLDNDNVLDLSIKLASISGVRASFYMEELQPIAEEIKPEEPVEQKPEEPEKEPVDERPGKIGEVIEKIKKIRGINKKPFIIMGIVIIIIGLSSGGFVYYRNVVERIKPMEDFIESALAKGYPKSKIRKELIETGWNEEVIESVLGVHKVMHKRKELKGYVEKALEQGFTKEQIKKIMAKRGWDEKDIKKLFK